MVTPQVLLLFGNTLIAFIEGLIGLRVILKLMGASMSAPFVRWIYETSKPVLYPFEGMFPSTQVAGVPFTIEFSALFALFFYIVIGYIFQEILDFISELKYYKKEKGRKKEEKND